MEFSMIPDLSIYTVNQIYYSDVRAISLYVFTVA